MNKKIVHNVFEHVTEKFTERIAVEFGSQTITYGILNQQANILGHALQRHGVSRESVVGIFLDSSIAYIASILAVCKSGGIFLPISLDFPQKRITTILNQTTPSVLITDEQNEQMLLDLIEESNLSAKVSTILVLGESDVSYLKHIRTDQGVSLEKDYSKENLTLISQGEDSNYIMYTSGSTGEPKAILGCQQSLSHFIHWEIGEFGVNEESRFSQLAPTTFDVSLRDIFVPLLAGGTLCIPEKAARVNPVLLLDYLEKSRVNLIHCVPTIFRLLIKEIEERGNSEQNFSSLQHILLAGEALYGGDVNVWRKLFGNRIELVNIYGPSETTLAKMFHRIGDEPFEENAILPVGNPISNTVVLIIKDGALCKIGEIGEIHIKTPFMSKGYYNAPELTQQSFIQNPLNSESKDIIYKTGDLGRYLPDRRVEILGRLDRQVKISGIRVELGEIEKIISQNEAIKQNIVIPHQSPNQITKLVCYYTVKQEIETSSLQTYLQSFFPDGMIPSFFVKLEEFPLNLNGKIDKRALPKPDELLFEDLKYEPPSSQIEAQLASIWEKELGLSRVGVNYPFVEIGGHSLNAINIIGKIYKTLGSELQVRAFFESGTIQKLAAIIEDSQKSVYEEISVLLQQEYYNLSHAQRRLWVLEQLDEIQAAYSIPFSFLLEGTLHLPAFQKAFQALIQRHESLRTTFMAVDGEPKQIVHQETLSRIEEIDLSSNQTPEEKAREIVRKEIHTPFDLEQGPLLRFKLLKLAKERYVMLFNIHHIIGDGISLNVIVKDFLHFYETFCQEKESSWTPLRIQYKDFAVWQNDLLESEKIQIHRDYWHHKLSGELPILNLPTDHRRPSIPNFCGNTLRFDLNPVLTKQLHHLSTENNASLFMILVAGMKTLLYHYTGQEDIIIGMPITGRVHPDLENQIGVYVNTLVLRNQVKGTMPFSTLLENVRQTTTEAYDHQIYPFDYLVEELPIARDMNQNPLFNVMMILQNQEETEFKLENVHITEFPVVSETSRFDLTFQFFEEAGRLSYEIIYDTDLFHETRIQRMSKHFETLMQNVLIDTTQPLHALNLLTEEEKQQLQEFNATKMEYSKDKTIVDIFEEQVEETPEALALIFNELELTYKELNERANQLAHYLRDVYRIQPEELVGVWMERSEWRIIALLGILKAGGAYLPIEPSYPESRIRFMLEDSQCKIVLSDPFFRQSANGIEQMTVLDITNLSQSDKTSNPISKITSDSLAYVIYTSGSTGVPKGAMIEHGGVPNMSLSHVQFFKIQPEDRILQFASASFDASLFEIFMALLCGASLVLIKKEVIEDLEKFTHYLEKQRVTIVTLPPSYLTTLRKYDLPFLRTIITAGEAAHAEEALYYSRTKQYFNAYGPSECTVWSSIYEVTSKQIDSESVVPIGKPITNTEILIVGEHLNLVPFGVPGEICIGGVGLGRGYLGREELTSEKFVSHPDHPEERLYRTGDLGLWQEDGNILFLGRKDDQVKIRGHRIELGEIIQRLLEHPNIKDGTVIDRSNEGGIKELVAYIITGKNNLEPTEIRHFLARSLPDYMLPAHFVKLDILPLTPNGKVDKEALPDPMKGNPDPGSYHAPRNEIEEQIANVWQEVLGKNPVGIHDNYFTLGGDSIKAIQMVSKLKEKHFKIVMRSIFQYQTIAELAQEIVVSEHQINQEVITGEVPLTAIQRWFFQEDRGGHHFNQAVMLSSKEKLEEEALQAVLTAIQNHHDALRMQYRVKEEGMIQENVDLDYPLGFELVDLIESPHVREQMESYAEQVQASIDLEQGPLMKSVLFRTQEGDRLLIVIHHLVIDGISWRILMEDFTQGYQQYQSDEPIVFPQKTNSFKEWAEAIHHYSQSSTLLEEASYWTKLASIKLNPLPQDAVSEDNLQKDSQSHSLFFSEETTQTLLSQAHQTYNTGMNDLLLTGLARMIQRWTGEGRILLSLEGHGRESIIENMDISRTVGWFTSEHPVLLDISGSEDLGYQIKSIKEILRKAPNNGVGYDILKYVTDPEKQPDLSLDITPQIIFNYLGVFDEDRESDLLSLSEESVGTTINPSSSRFALLEINGLVVKGKLELTFSYNRKMYHHPTIEMLVRFYEEELSKIITHCLKAEPELTPSDADYEGLDIETLDEILDHLSD